MTKRKDLKPQSPPVYAVTKSIRVYSDNRCHMAIATFIDIVNSLDEGRGITRRELEDFVNSVGTIALVLKDLTENIHEQLVDGEDE